MFVFEYTALKEKTGFYGTDTLPNNPIDEKTKQKVIGAIKNNEYYITFE